MPADEKTARRDLEALLPTFHRSVLTGVRAYYGEYPKTAHRHRTITRRCITRDEIVYDLRGALDGREGVRVIDDNQTTYIYVDDRYRILVKKSDESGLVELAKTQTSFEFQCNEQDDLFGVVHTNLYLSYIPNQNDPDEPTVLLICPNSTGYEWVMELEPPAAEIAGEICGPTRPDEGDDLVRVPTVEKSEESE